MGTAALEWVVGHGDLVLTLALAGFGAALLWAFKKDRELKHREHADRVRTAAARALAKLCRWPELSLSFFADLDSTLVETSALLASDPDVARAREFLSRKAAEARRSVTSRLIDEQIDIAYVSLYGYQPAIHRPFAEAVVRLRSIQGDAFDRFLEDSQTVVLAFEGRRDGDPGARLGDALRAVAKRRAMDMHGAMDEALAPIRGLLEEIVERPDRTLPPSPA